MVHSHRQQGLDWLPATIKGYFNRWIKSCVQNLPRRPKCRCRCGCLQTPSRLIQCPRCLSQVGPGCDRRCWDHHRSLCHICVQELTPEPPEPDPEPEPATWRQAIPDYRTKCVPMKLHGDSIVCVGRGQTWQRSFNTWSFSSMVSSATSSLSANFLFWSFNQTLAAQVQVALVPFFVG